VEDLPRYGDHVHGHPPHVQRQTGEAVGSVGMEQDLLLLAYPRDALDVLYRADLLIGVLYRDEDGVCGYRLRDGGRIHQPLSVDVQHRYAEAGLAKAAAVFRTGKSSMREVTMCLPFFSPEPGPRP